MTPNKLRLAIISDLHCHPEREKFKDNSTNLFSDKLRSPSDEHPVENLIELINSDALTVNLVLCPGDFTDQCDRQGFLSGWSYVKEIAEALKADDIIATRGNHDIDSRHNYSKYSFDIAKKIKQNFPLKEEYLGTFWDKGYTFIEQPSFQILVVDSTHYHTHDDKMHPTENPIVKGQIDRSQIKEIARYLDDHDDNLKIKILLCHHHPIKHSRNGLGEHDFIDNGEELIQLLGSKKFDLIVHGHKHDPWLRYFDTSQGHILPILSSGSFSATNQILWANKFNYVHFIDIVKDGNVQAKGSIQTLTFINRTGWKNDRDDGFSPYTGFGCFDDLRVLSSRIKEEMGKEQVVEWKNILLSFPDIYNLPPDKLIELEVKLKENGIYLSDKIGNMPQHIFMPQTPNNA